MCSGEVIHERHTFAVHGVEIRPAVLEADDIAAIQCDVRIV